MGAGRQASLPSSGIAKLAARFSERSMSPALDASLKASRAWSNPGVLEQLRTLDTVGKQVMWAGRTEEQLKAFDRVANQVQMTERLKPQLQRLVEGNLPLNSWRRGLNSPAAAELAALGGVRASVELNQEIVKAGERLMASTNFPERVKSRLEEISKNWSAAGRLSDLYPRVESVRLAKQLDALPASAAGRLRGNYSFEGLMASQAVAQAARRGGLLSGFDHAQARKMAEQHLQLMPNWSVAEMVRMKVGINDLARLGAPRPGQEPAATLQQLTNILGRRRVRPFEPHPGLASAIRLIDYPQPPVGTAVIAPAPGRLAEIEPAPVRPAPQPQHQPREDHEVAPVAASFFAGRDRQLVVSLLDTAQLEEERQHLEALEERLRAGHLPARNHAAVSARQLLLGVANYCLPPQPDPRPCRFDCQYCPHELGAADVKNRIIAFVDERLRGQLDVHEFKIFVAHADYVFRWGSQGTHQKCGAPEAVKALVRLLEVLAVVARAAQAQHPAQLQA